VERGGLGDRQIETVDVSDVASHDHSSEVDIPKRKQSKATFPPGFWVIWTTVALDLVGFGMVVPILGIYAKSFHAGALAVGLMFAAFSLAQFICAPLLGRLSDRIGRKPVILISLFGTAIGSIVTGAANALWVLFVGRVIDGASGASVAVAQGAVTDLADHKDRPHLLGMLGAAFGVGFVVGPAFGGLASLIGRRVPFFVAGGIAFVNALLAIKRLPETRRPEPGSGSVAGSGRTARLWTMAAVGFLGIGAFSGFESTFSLFANKRFGLGQTGVSVVFVAIGVLLVLAQMRLLRGLVRRIGSIRALQYGMTLNGIGLLLLAVSRHWYLLVPALFALTIGQALAQPNLTAVVASRVPDEQRGEALGFQQGANAIGRVAGPALAGALFQHVGVSTPYLVGAALVLLAIVLVTAPQGRNTLSEA
jgi:MFS transporter, DHA1 family, tetracycline resistance protein